MWRLKALVVDNAADFLFNLAGFLIIYLVARQFRASPLMAMSFAVLPLLVAFLMQHPDSSSRLYAMLR